MNRAEKNRKFLSKENWDDIKRGWIFEAVVTFTPERPLDFFIPDPKDKTKGYIQRGLGHFIPGTIQKAIVELKTRKVLILSRDEHCSAKDIYDVTVAPIYGIYEEDRKEDWYPKVLDGTHPFFAHLPKEVTGRECLIDMTNIISVSKSMLLEEKYDINDRMEHVEELLQYCLSLGIYKRNDNKKKSDDAAG